MSQKALTDIDKFLYARHPNGATDEEEMCLKEKEGVKCTRPKGHSGRCEAHGLMGMLIAHWESDENHSNTARLH